MRLRVCTAALLLAPLGTAATAFAQEAGPANLSMTAGSSAATVEELSNPEAGAWRQAAALRVSLNRTPPLYDTDPPSVSEISELEVRLARTGGKLLLHLRWMDRTRDTAEITALPDAPAEGRDKKEFTEATDRFFDAVAVMVPVDSSESGRTPGLQMGDTGHAVTIYYWNAARGASVMEGQGRGTTRRTAETFPARATYRNGAWLATLELPDLPEGTPLAFAVWNGSQLDRDGRKYFSVWHWLE